MDFDHQKDKTLEVAEMVRRGSSVIKILEEIKNVNWFAQIVID